jgi:hypothetical protein
MLEINLDDFTTPPGMAKYSKEALEEGKKYYGEIRFYPDGRIFICDYDGNEIEEWADTPIIVSRD